MESNKGIRLREINVFSVLEKLKKNKKRYIINLTIAFVVSSFIILCVPRTYTCVVKLAPETSSSSMSGLSSIASSFGLNMSNGISQDAIIPELYPDLMRSVDFQTSMFPVKVTTSDGEVNTTYYNYLLAHQKSTWWGKIINKVILFFKSKKSGGENGNEVNPFKLTKVQNEIAQAIGGMVRCSIDKKTDVITITVIDQDPLVCATIADSAKVRLQQFIIDYRTNKAKIDLQYTEKLYAEAKKQYEISRKNYATFVDSNQNLILEQFRSRQTDLENEMQLQFNNYQQISNQLQLAKAKIQERTPAFTTLQSASVPLKPSGPKRMVFVLFWVFVTFCATSLYVFTKKV